jgi:hypothetical protein
MDNKILLGKHPMVLQDDNHYKKYHWYTPQELEILQGSRSPGYKILPLHCQDTGLQKWLPMCSSIHQNTSQRDTKGRQWHRSDREGKESTG